MTTRLLVGAILVAGGALARKPPRPPPSPPPAIAPVPTPHAIEIQVLRRGEMTRMSFTGDAMRVLLTTTGPAINVPLPPALRTTLFAALAALPLEGEVRRSCGPDEIFLSVTVDGRTGWIALCLEERADEKPWRALLESLRPLAAAAAH